MEQWPPGAHGSTFGGNPVSCAAAIATLDVIEDEGLLARAELLGDRARDGLRALLAECPELVDVRGLGLMVGVELVDAAAAQRVQTACLDAGLLVLTCGPGENVLRLVPPLTVSDDEMDEGLRILTGAIRGTARPAPTEALSIG
jgi:4-aminobutyrate aminotransferase